MNNREDFGYMSLIEAVSDVDNTFLSRREITCNFVGLGGKLKKLEAVEMVSKEFKLDGKVIIPISMKNHSGKPLITGTFYVYDDENLAKAHVNPVIFKRLEKAKSAGEQKEEVKEEAAEPGKKTKEEAAEPGKKTKEEAAEPGKKAKEEAAEPGKKAKEEAAEAPAVETKAEEKPEDESKKAEEKSE